MNKKLFSIFLMLFLLVASPVLVSAGGSSSDAAPKVEKLTTFSGCAYTKNECNRYEDCLWVEEADCGINISKNSYSCYYWLEYGKTRVLVTAYFNANGLSSLEYATNDPSKDGNKAFPKEPSVPVVKTTDYGLEYYQCPESLYEVDVDLKKEDNTLVNYRYFTIDEDEYANEYKLTKHASFKNIMAIKKLPDSYEEDPEQEVLEPKTCEYTKTVGKDQRTISITYHDRNNVSATYNGLSVNGNVYKVNTSYIKNSQYFKDWVCPPEDVVFAYVDSEGTLYVSYNKEDLGNHSDIFAYEGDNDDVDLDTDIGDSEYGCEVIPYEIREWIQDTLNLVKYFALALVIVLGILDFIKAATSGEADQMKKSGTSFLRRIIAVAILFLLPVIVDLILNLVEIYGADSTCLPQ